MIGGKTTTIKIVVIRLGEDQKSGKISAKC